MAEVNKYQQTGPKVVPGSKQEMVYTWPYLVSIEAIMAVAMTLALTIMSTLVNAPLLDLANGDVTPNPAKAPWYFLGLQELLLHMHPALAGVIVPTAALVLLGMIPYLDRDRHGTGIWFSTKRGIPLTIIATVYTWIIELALILADEWFTLPGMQEGSKGIAAVITHLLSKIAPRQWVDWVGPIFLPIVLMIAIPWVLVVIVRKIYKNLNTREIMITLYSFYFASFLILTIIGTAFRGESMMLMWPWDVKPPH